MDDGFWSKVLDTVSKALHYITGWIVHPDKGGCCYEKDEKNVDK